MYVSQVFGNSHGCTADELEINVAQVLWQHHLALEAHDGNAGSFVFLYFDTFTAGRAGAMADDSLEAIFNMRFPLQYFFIPDVIVIHENVGKRYANNQPVRRER